MKSFLLFFCISLITFGVGYADDLNGIQTEVIFQNFCLKKVPLFVDTNNENVIEFQFFLDAKKNYTGNIEKIELVLSAGSDPSFLEKVKVFITSTENQLTLTQLAGETTKFSSTAIIFQKNIPVKAGSNKFSIDFITKNNPELTKSFGIEKIKMTLGKQIFNFATKSSFLFRPALVLRSSGKDNVNTYRIPGLTTTNQGTLIAVYDVRYNNSKDLQENIDVGMSRSTDGGQTWEPMKIIMDMGKWGGYPEKLNGIGDPCVLYDAKSGILWVAGLWMNGASEKDALWWASEPGMQPHKTGQFILVKSTDDGKTWSKPVNITQQIKDPKWQLLFQGPGRGITTNDGILVFPVQFKADIGEKAIDGGKYTCHSSIIFSRDCGKTWYIGTGAKANTTEAQVVELSDGCLMLNMRDDRNRKDKSETNGRAVAITKDLGKTWEIHPTSNLALPESNCMASIISSLVKQDNVTKNVLFFSNPNNKYQRSNMTVKASLDDGLTWPVEFQEEINESLGYGYSCMTMVDENTIGILYEGVKELYFQKIPVADLLGK